jgi:hypothetical protein
MKNHISPDVPFEEWCNTWIAPMVLMMPCPALEPVLAKAFQLRPQTLPFIVDICSTDVKLANHISIFRIKNNIFIAATSNAH